jgi:hypothetical protein
MIIRASVFPAWPRTAASFALLSLGVLLSGCADIGENVSTAFADPAKYELYDCKQLETERKTLANRAAELQALMAKAETGVAGSVVSELAYRNDYVAVRGQTHFAEEAWRKNRCHESPPAPLSDAKPGPPGKPAGRAKPAQQSSSAQQSKPAQQAKPATSSKSGAGTY